MAAVDLCAHVQPGSKYMSQCASDHASYIYKQQLELWFVYTEPNHRRLQLILYCVVDKANILQIINEKVQNKSNLRQTLKMKKIFPARMPSIIKNNEK